MPAFANDFPLCVTRMKLKFIISLIVAMFQLAETSIGQENAKGNDVVEGLKLILVDSLVHFRSPQVSQNKFLHAHGYVTFLETSYVFYQKDGQSFAKQIVEYCNGDCSVMKRAVSHPFRLEDSGLFAFISSNVEMIKFEEIRPYTYSLLDTLTGEEYYQIAGSYHSTYHIEVVLDLEKFEKSVNMFDFEKFGCKGCAPNLNYGYNTKTQLKKLIDLLLKMSYSLQNQFQF
ncbi:MAG: hypothetical protein EOP48_27440 [Sphingobacteriales bacterium]|nr:MAG: hypothetical protein EOP48_27440 [Sphingobacteriales bacterium]